MPQKKKYIPKTKSYLIVLTGAKTQDNVIFRVNILTIFVLCHN